MLVVPHSVVRPQVSSGTRSGHRPVPQPAGIVAADAEEGACASASGSAEQRGVCLEGLPPAGCGGSHEAGAHLPRLPSAAGVTDLQDMAATATELEGRCLEGQWQGVAEDMVAMAMLADYGQDDDAVLVEAAEVSAGSGSAETGAAGADVAEAGTAGAVAVDAAADARGGDCADATYAVSAAAEAGTVGAKEEEEATMSDVGEDHARRVQVAGGLREARSEADWCRVPDQEWDPVLPEQVLCRLCPFATRRF